MNQIKLRALLKDGYGYTERNGSGWRYGVYPYIAPEMSNTVYPMFKFWEQFRSAYQRQTLGIFIGIKDSNGKEIYDGDIVTYGTEDAVVNATVEFAEEDSEESMFLTGYKMVVINAADYEDNDDNEHALEIIGNIFENPELIKEDK